MEKLIRYPSAAPSFSESYTLNVMIDDSEAPNPRCRILVLLMEATSIVAGASVVGVGVGIGAGSGAGVEPEDESTVDEPPGPQEASVSARKSAVKTSMAALKPLPRRNIDVLPNCA